MLQLTESKEVTEIPEDVKEEEISRLVSAIDQNTSRSDNLMDSIIDNFLKYGNHDYYLKNTYKDCCCFGFSCFKF